VGNMTAMGQPTRPTQVKSTHLNEIMCENQKQKRRYENKRNVFINLYLRDRIDRIKLLTINLSAILDRIGVTDIGL